MSALPKTRRKVTEHPVDAPPLLREGQNRSNDSQLIAEANALRLSVRLERGKARRNWEEAKSQAEIQQEYVEALPEKEQNAEVNSQEIHHKSVVPSKSTFESAVEYFASRGVTEQNRQAAANIAAQLIEADQRDPEAAKATLAAMQDVLATGAATPEAGSFTQRVGRSRASAAPDKAPATGQSDVPPRGRKNAVHYSPEEIREARRIVSWQARHKDTPLNPDNLRKANRVVRWADRQKQRQAQADKDRSATLG